MRQIFINTDNKIIQAVTAKADLGGIELPEETVPTNHELVEHYYWLDDVLVIDPEYDTKVFLRVQQEAVAIVKRKYAQICKGKDPATGLDIYVDCVVGEATYRMNAGQNAATSMDSGVRISVSIGATTMPIVRDFNNVNHLNMPIDDAVEISRQQGVDALDYWQQKGSMIDAINAANTEDAVLAVDTTFNVNV